MTPIKVLAAGLAGLALIPVLVLGAVAGGFGDSPSPGSSAQLPERSELAGAVLGDPAIDLTPAARGDVAAGTVDPRVLAVLLWLSQTHDLGPVGPLITGHSYYVRGTKRVSNHVYGRAVDILGVDGVPVSPTNEAAREVMQQILTLDPPLAPDELGGPWLLSSGSRSSFTNPDHQDHIHIGWEA